MKCGWKTFAILAATDLVIACGPKTVASPPARVSAQEMLAAQLQMPGATDVSLNAARDLYVAKCNRCHGYPDLTAIPDEEWPEVMEEMGKKAGFTEEQQAQVLAFVRVAKAR